MEKKTPIKFYDVFEQFSRTYEVAKFSMTKLYLEVSDVTDASECAKHANCGLHVNFLSFLLIPFRFMIKKIILRKSCHFGLRSPLKLV